MGPPVSFPLLIFVCQNFKYGRTRSRALHRYKDVHIFLTGKKLQTAQSRSRIFIPNRQYEKCHVLCLQSHKSNCFPPRKSEWVVSNSFLPHTEFLRNKIFENLASCPTPPCIYSFRREEIGPFLESFFTIIMACTRP